MKLGIDTFDCDHGKSGQGSYVLSLVRNIPQCDDLEFELFGEEHDRYVYTKDNPIKYTSAEVKETASGQRFWHNFGFSRFCRKNSYDAVLFAAGARMLPSSFSVPGVAVVNELVSAVIRGNDFNYFSRQQILKGLAHADCIIVPSKFIKSDLEKLGIRNKNIEIIHPAVDTELFQPNHDLIESDIADIKPFAIKKPYIIYARRMVDSEKKHVELIKAFSMFKKKTGLPHRLVIAGSEGPYSSKVHEAAFESEFASEIFLTGFFPRESFPDLYKNAELCVFPSVNEGMGLPVLEAMASGIPVACSREGALQEIAGDCALFFDSNDVCEIAGAIEKIVSDKNLASELVKKGLDHVKNYTWKMSAEKTIEIIRKYVM